MSRSAIMMSVACDEATARRGSRAVQVRSTRCGRIQPGFWLALLLVSVAGGVSPASGQIPSTSTVVVLPGDPGWFAFTPEGSAVQIGATNPRAGLGSLELVTGIGSNALFSHEIAAPGFGTFGELTTLTFDWFIDPASKTAFPPELSLRVYPFGDPRSFFLRWESCNYAVSCAPHPVGSWQSTDLIGRLSIRSADGHLPPASMADIPADAPIVDVTVSGHYSYGQPPWHGFVDNVSIGFAGSATTYNFEVTGPAGTRTMPVITWPAPAPIPTGTPLTSAQLNATADVLGAFKYTPPTGSTLPADFHTLVASFLPADPALYLPVAASMPLTVTGLHIVDTADFTWSPYQPGGSSAAISPANPRTGTGSLELTSAAGNNSAYIHEYYIGRSFGTFSELSGLSFDWFIDPASSVALPPEIALRVYPYGDPRSFFLYWDTCSATVPCDPHPTASWQSTDLMGKLSIQSADGNPPPDSMAEIPADAPIVGIHARGNYAFGQPWHGFVDNISIAFGVHAPITYNFELPGAPGSISGRVTNAATGVGLPFSSVDLFSSSGTYMTSRPTDAAGAYSASGLAPGVYYAAAFSQGFIYEIYNSIQCVNCSVVTGTPIAVIAGVATGPIDFALDAGGRIAGKVVNASGGAALAGVQVHLYDASGQWTTSGVTDTSGEYTTESAVLPGTYFAGTSNSSGFLNELYDDVPCATCSLAIGIPIPLTSATTIVLTAGVTRPNIDFALAEGGRISGAVTQSAGGAAIANVQVDIFDNSGLWVGYGYTDASGGYLTSPGLPGGTYFAKTSNSQAYIDELYDNIACGPYCFVTSGRSISVTPGITTGPISFELDAGGRIEGTVTNAATASPLAGIQVDLYDASGEWASYGYSDESGHYISGPGMRSGTYYARTWNDLGLINEVYENTICLNCDVTTGAPITVTAGGTISDIDFALAEGGRITGRVVYPPASAASGDVQVEIYNGVGSLVASSYVPPAPLNYITAEGLPAGTYYARTTNTLGLLDELYDNIACITTAGGVCNPSTGAFISVAVGTTTPGIDFDLVPGGRIGGTVTHSSTGAPLANVSVQIYNVNGVLLDISFTDNSGTYLSGSGLPAGSYFARTFNASGFVDKLYNNVSCVGCIVTTGALIPVSVGTTTRDIDFALAPGGTITGRVTSSATGAGLLASVQFFDSSGNFVTGLNTDAAGEYSSSGLPAGTYYVRAQSNSFFIPQMYNGVACPSCNVTTGTPISVTVGSAADNINFTLAPGGVVSGRVINAATGAGIAFATVQLYDSSGNFAAGPFTDAAGAYSSSGLAAGVYYARTFNSQGFIDELHNNIQCVTCSVVTGLPIFVTLGVASNIDFALNPGGRISGKVVHASGGAALAGVEVVLYNASGQWIVNGFTDASGNYTTLGGVPAGTYYARTSNSLGFVNKLYNNITCDACAVTTGTPITLAAGAIASNIDFALNAGGRISGRVTSATTGAGLANIKVMINDGSRRFIAQVFSGPTGNYVLPEGIPSGNYFASTFNEAGYVDEVYNNITCVSCDATAGTPIPVSGGVTTGSIDFALETGGRLRGRVTDASTGEPVSPVSVLIHDSQGSFLTRASTDPSGDYITWSLPAGTYFAHTFNAHGYVQELYENIPCAASCVVTSGTPIPVTASNTTNNIDFALDTGGRIAGSVTNAVTGSPIADVEVDIYDAGGERVTDGFSDASGNYFSSDGLPPGIYYAVTWNALGYINELFDNITRRCVDCEGTEGTKGTPITVTQGTTTGDINFELSPGGRVGGTVTSSVGGAPLADVGIALYDSAGEWVNYGFTDASGNYLSLGGLPAGTYYAQARITGEYVNQLYSNVQCLACDITTAGTPIVVTQGFIATGINFALELGGRVAGKVTTSAGAAAIPDVQVQVYDASGRIVTDGYTDDAGNYISESGLPTGSYYARTRNMDGYVDKLYDDITCAGCTETTGRPISVAAGSTIGDVNFSLAVGGRIAGTVTGVGAGALHGVAVSIYHSSGRLVTDARTNPSGAYTTLTGLPSDTYFARTSNSPGYDNMLYDNIQCTGSSCDVTAGSGILVTSPGTTDSIDFALAITAAGDPRVTFNEASVGGAATVKAIVADGPGNAADWVALYATGSATYLDWKYLNGTRSQPAVGATDAEVPFTMPLTPGTYVVRFYANNTGTLLATSAPITVVSATIAVIPSPNVPPGGTVTATIANGPGNAGDWIGLYAADSVTRITWKYLNGEQTLPAAGMPGAVVLFTLPQTPGSYTLRFYAANLPTPLATSPTLTVLAPPTNPTLVANPTTPGPGATVTATIAFGPGGPTDWVGLFAPDGTRLDWKYLNGTKTPPATGRSSAELSFTLPITPGTYTLRLHPNNGYTVLASATVAVGDITFTAIPTTPAGTWIAKLINGPGNAGDWVGLFAADGSRLAWKYLNGTQTAPAGGLTSAEVLFTLPTTAGSYTLRLYANYSQTVLATAAPITVAPPAAATVTVTPATPIAPGATVQALIENGPGNAADWIALYATGGSTYLDWMYLNGTRSVPATGVKTATVDITLPTTPGAYTLHFYQNNSYTLLASSATITVFSVTLTVESPAAPGATVQVDIAGGPGNATDWVALFAADGVTRLDWKYLNGSRTAPTTGLSVATVLFTLPTTPGVYSVRLYAKNTQTLLASATVTVP